MYWTVWPSATKVEEKTIKNTKEDLKKDSVTIFYFRGTYWTEWRVIKKTSQKICKKYLKNFHEPTRLRTKMKTKNSGHKSGAAIFRGTSHAKLPIANFRATADLRKKCS